MLVNYSDEVGDCHYIGEYKNEKEMEMEKNMMVQVI